MRDVYREVMLRITVELLPAGCEDRKETLHVLEIANRGWPRGMELGGEKHSLRNYEFSLNGGPWLDGVEHDRSKPVWELIEKVAERLKPCAQPPFDP